MSSDEENNPHKGNGWKLQLLQLPRWVVACMSSNSNRKLKGWKKAPKAERWEFLSFTNGIKKESHWRRQEEGEKNFGTQASRWLTNIQVWYSAKLRKFGNQGVNMPSVVATLQEAEAGISVVQGCPQLQHQVWGQSCLRPIWKFKKKKKIKKHVLGFWNLQPMNLSFPWSIDFANTHTFIWSSHVISWYQQSHFTNFESQHYN